MIVVYREQAKFLGYFDECCLIESLHHVCGILIGVHQGPVAILECIIKTLKWLKVRKVQQQLLICSSCDLNSAMHILFHVGIFFYLAKTEWEINEHRLHEVFAANVQSFLRSRSSRVSNLIVPFQFIHSNILMLCLLHVNLTCEPVCEYQPNRRPDRYNGIVKH
jgi:hypothetical protein